MELEYKNEKFEVSYNKATALIRKNIISILKKAPPSKEKKLLELQKKIFNLAIADGGANEKTMQEVLIQAVNEKKISQKEFLSLLETDYEDGVNNDTTIIEIFKIIINRYDLTKEQIKLIDSKFDSEFWQTQDILEMENAVNSFRSNLRI